MPLSEGEYGATTSLPRILDLLDRQGVPAAFFMPAMGTMLHPEMVPVIVSRQRHEIAVHGWMHEFWPVWGMPQPSSACCNKRFTISPKHPENVRWESALRAPVSARIRST